MKRLLSVLFLYTSFFSYAQDTIKCYNSKPIIADVIEIDDNLVKYQYQGEKIINTIYKTDFSEIVLSSGRVIKGIERIQINGEDDWEKVIITFSESDVKGLEKVCGISETSTSSGWGAHGNLDKYKAKAKDGLKKKAAKLGCHIVLITEDNSRDGDTNQSFKWTKASYNGIAYKYPSIDQ